MRLCYHISFFIILIMSLIRFWAQLYSKKE